MENKGPPNIQYIQCIHVLTICISAKSFKNCRFFFRLISLLKEITANVIRGYIFGNNWHEKYYPTSSGLGCNKWVKHLERLKKKYRKLIIIYIILYSLLRWVRNKLAILLWAKQFMIYRRNRLLLFLLYIMSGSNC